MQKFNVSIITVFIYLCFLFVLAKEERPVVTTMYGKLVGINLESRNNRNYYAFRGIPYAKVPGMFQESVSPDNWNGLRDASAFGERCTQIYNGVLIGSQNCLNLNIYTNNVTNGSPVMVWFHGGGFVLASGDTFHAKYFMDEDVVLVTVNYRLGVLGFLSTGDGVVPGNNGLKDQVMALNWIQKNIRQFGGDPNSVTIFGQSAGGASVHYHMMSPMSTGLFRYGISHSGTALSPWAYQNHALKNAEKLGELLGCRIRTNKKRMCRSEELLKCFMNADVLDLLLAQNKVLGPKPQFEGLNIVFVPTKESPLSNSPRFLLESPHNLTSSESGLINSVPWISGVTEQEGVWYTASTVNSQKLLNDMNGNWSEILPKVLFYASSPNHENISESVHQFYIGNETVGPKSRENFTTAFSDRLFNIGFVNAAKRQAQHSPVYPYILNYKGSYSTIAFYYDVPWNFGVGHLDDLQYFFNGNSGSPDYSGESEDAIFSRNIVRLWTSFAKNGNPTSTWGNEKNWNRLNSTVEPINIYMLGSDTTTVLNPFFHGQQFWTGLPLGEDEI